MPVRPVAVRKSELAKAVLAWLSELRRSGFEIAVLEGLPGAGKTTLLSQLKTEFVSWYLVELDDFLRRPEDQSRPWADIVIDRGAHAALDKWSAEGPTLVEGACAWPVVRRWLAERPANRSVKRAYLKRVTGEGTVTFWDDGEGLAEHARRHEPFFASIYVSGDMEN